MKRPNGRKYPRDLRQEEALKRQEKRNKRSSEGQLELLDERLGIDTGAIKERTRLMKEGVETNQKTRNKDVKNPKIKRSKSKSRNYSSP
jgi:hypothetical protein